MNTCELHLLGADSAGAIIFLFIALVVVVAILGALASAKRRKELTEWANQNGLTFSPSKDHSFDDIYSEFASCLRRGHSRYASNILSGQWNGRGFTGFDYHYTTGHGKNRSRHIFSAVILTNDFDLGKLSIRPEGFFDKITEFVGFDDIDFESAEFSRKFYVKAPNRKWAYDVLHARTMEFLLSVPQFHLQFEGKRVLAYKNGTFKPHEFEQAAAVIEGIIDRLPGYVVEQQKGLR